jgi:hypothetical protein
MLLKHKSPLKHCMKPGKSWNFGGVLADIKKKRLMKNLKFTSLIWCIMFLLFSQIHKYYKLFQVTNHFIIPYFKGQYMFQHADTI